LRHFLLAPAALFLLAAGPTTTLQRDRHEDTIYVVQGAPDQLSRFEQDVGSRWKGGKLLKREDGTYYYWAFPDRTAPQARELMLGAITSGLLLDIREYDQSDWFAAARSTLDTIAISCGLQRDPFFISPAGELQMSFQGGTPGPAIDCARQKLKGAELPDISKRPQN
jgi:hypothetical protein